MADNHSLTGAQFFVRSSIYRVILVQVFITIFLCINFMQILTFFMKDFFYTTMRYILFAVTLLSDCTILIISNVLVFFDYYQLTMQIWLCLILCIFSYVYSKVTPLTLMVMTLERYVAICMPLRHAELCSTRRSLHCILIIHGLSTIPCIAILSVFFASASPSFYKQYQLCGMETFSLYTWQNHLRSAVNLFYFFIMCMVIMFSYVKVMKVAKAASGENKKSSQKGLRTVILHAFQLLLCLNQLWCTLIESAIFHIDLMLYVNVRYFNYIFFILAPRCLSPLIYGLRDEKFYIALKYYVFCGLYQNKSQHL